ncbi:hypothetical protein EI94DRAFT_1806824 [Lactarius quietus]|nr:hypothetical protein EI94DRAFT_1806824 [Lactarius quietus]
MDLNGNHLKQSFLNKDLNVSIEFPHVAHTSPSDPEEDVISDAHSFNEEDMYGSDNNDDIIVVCPDSQLDLQASSDDHARMCLELASDLLISLVGIFDDVMKEVEALRADLREVSAMVTETNETWVEDQGETGRLKLVMEVDPDECHDEMGLSTELMGR